MNLLASAAVELQIPSLFERWTELSAREHKPSAYPTDASTSSMQ